MVTRQGLKFRYTQAGKMQNPEKKKITQDRTDRKWTNFEVLF